MVTGSCVYVWLSACTQSSSLTVRWHQLKQHASSLSVISFLLLAKSCWCFPKHVVREASCMFTFKAGWRPDPDQTATVHSRVWVKTMLLWGRLISDGSSRAGWGCFPLWSSAVSLYPLWHSNMWEIKCGTKMIILNDGSKGLMLEVSLGEVFPKAGPSTEAVDKLCEKLIYACPLPVSQQVNIM